MARISIGTWTFTVGRFVDEPVRMEEVARRAADLGFDGIALGGFEPHGSVERYPTQVSRKGLSGMVKDMGLELNSYAADLLDCDFYNGDPAAVERYNTRFDRSLEFCADCEIPVIRVDTVTMTPYPPDFQYQKAWDTAVELFRRDAEQAGAAGITVAWEFEPGRLFNKPSEILGLLRAVDRDNFTIQYDTAHGQLCAWVGAHQYGEKEVLPGGQRELIEQLKGKIGDVHLIDTDNTMRNDANSNKIPFGRGVVDFETVVETILKSGYNGDWWTVDLGPQQGDVWAIAENARQYVARLLVTLQQQ